MCVCVCVPYGAILKPEGAHFWGLMKVEKNGTTAKSYQLFGSNANGFPQMVNANFSLSVVDPDFKLLLITISGEKRPLLLMLTFCREEEEEDDDN